MRLADAKQMALDLMEQHLDAEHLLVEGWHFAWSNRKRAAGHVRDSTKTLYLSKPITRLNDEATVRNTILHEIAHIIAGPEHGHDKHWKRVAREVGAKPKRCGDFDTPTKKFVGTCPACGARFYRHRRTRTASCPRCSRGWDERYVLVWSLNDEIEQAA